MNWIILAVVLALLVPTGIAIERNWPGEIGAMLAAVGLFGALITGVIASFGFVSAPKHVNLFERQKVYIESYRPEYSAEMDALSAKKLELNEWLYDAQFSKHRFGNWSFYSDEIFSLEPIS